MERLKLKYRDACKAITTLKEILDEPFSIIICDASIQRFEYTFEAFWKFIKEYLKEKEGIRANSPKKCFKEIFSLEFANEEETVELLEMTDKRNDTAHTYKEEVAQNIYNKIGLYFSLMEKVLNRLNDKIDN
ncbi:MAG: HI0074 family nucleotidyltransferase substrate-binding subunit [Candidatus Omnitrophota bacterium]